MERRVGADRSQVEGTSHDLGQTHRVVDPGDPPRDLSGWAWGAFVCLGLVATVCLVRIVVALDLHSTLTDGGDVVGSYRDYDRWVGISALMLVVTAGVFITWFFQAYKNLRRLGLQNMRYGNGWAIGAWFVPILSLIRPKQIANDIWRGSERGAEVANGWRLLPVAPLLNWWWALFVVQGLLSWYGQRRVESGYDKLVTFGIFSSGLDQMKSGTTADVLGAIVGVAAAVLAILVVSRVTVRLNEIRDEALAQAPPVPQYATAPRYPPVPATPLYPSPPATPSYAQAAPMATQHSQAPAPPPPAPTPPPTEERVQCPECAEWIQAQANVCRFCGFRLRPLGQ